MANGMIRWRTMVQMLRPGLGATPQIVFKESCNCPKTPEAPNSKVTTPMIVATIPASLRARILDHSLDKLSRLLSHSPTDLAHKLTLHRLATEHQSGDADRNNQQWRHRKDGIVSQRSGQT